MTLRTLVLALVAALALPARAAAPAAARDTPAPAPSLLQQADAALESGEPGSAQRAAELYQSLLEKPAPGVKVDEVLLSLGYALEAAGKSVEARAAWQRVIKDFPASHSVADAWTALGQSALDAAHGKPDAVQEALGHFRQATRRNPKLSDAHLGQARCLRDLGEYKPALEAYEAALASGRAAELSPETLAEWADELVALYAQSGDPAIAVAQLRKAGGAELGWRMLKKLGLALHERGRIEDATGLFRFLLKDRPRSPDAPLFQWHLAGYVVRSGKKPEILAAIGQLAESITGVRTEGSFGSDEDKQSLALALSKTESLLAPLAAAWHEEAQATKAPQDVTLASDLCGLYLQLFPEGSQAAEMKRCAEGS